MGSDPTSGALWFTDAAFWPAVAPVLFDAEYWSAAAAECDGIVQALGLDRGASVLDVFCGPGRYVVPLAQRGFRVTGVDASPEYLAEARERVASAGFDAERVRLVHRLFQDIPGQVDVEPGDSPTLDGPFDGVLWLGSSSGYGSVAHDRSMLAWIRSRMRSGARLLIEGSTREDLESLPIQAVRWFEQRGDAAQDAEGSEPTDVVAVWRLSQHVERTDEEWRLRSRWQRFVNGTQKAFDFDYRVYSRPQWRDMLHEAGFSNVMYSNTLDGLTSAARNPSDSELEWARSWIRAEAAG